MNTESIPTLRLSTLQCEALLNKLSQQGIYLILWKTGVQVFSFEANRLSNETRDFIKKHKHAIIHYLSNTKIPLSFSQQRLWFLDQYEGGQTTTYNLPIILRVRGELSVDALEWAFNKIIVRHQILRTSFADEGNETFQVIAPKLALKLVVQACDANELDAALDKEVYQSFDLSKGTLIRVGLFRLEKQEHVLTVCQHHIISDGWSLRLFWQEIVACYDAYIKKGPPQLAELPFQYADFSRWQWLQLRAGYFTKSLAYWKKQLSGVEPLCLFTDKPRPAKMNYQGVTTETVL